MDDRLTSIANSTTVTLGRGRCASAIQPWSREGMENVRAGRLFDVRSTGPQVLQVKLGDVPGC